MAESDSWKQAAKFEYGLSQCYCVGSTINIIFYFILIDACISETFAKKICFLNNESKDEKWEWGCMRIVINTAQEYRGV